LLGVIAAAGALVAGLAHAADRVMPTGEPDALAFLKSLPREWAGTSRRDCKTYEDKNIDRLSSAFATSAARFLKAFLETHGRVTITSAHRTAQEQTCVCDGERGPCAGRLRFVKTKKKGRRIAKRTTSHHQSGIALDVRAGTGSKDEFACMHEFARFNPQFGVHFPMGKRDQPHMEPYGFRAGHARAAGTAPARIVPCARMRIMLTDMVLD
jgi:hypothetical protein